MSNTVNVEDIMISLASALDARRDHDTALKNFEDEGRYSWQWYGRALIGERDASMAHLGDTLEKYIDQRVAVLLKTVVDQ